MRLTLHILATLALLAVGLLGIAGILWATQTSWGPPIVGGALVVFLCWVVAWKVWPWLRGRR